MIKEKLYFELIQIAIGSRICLSHTPSADEWGELYAMAKKQSLVGICFAGVQRLQQQRQEPPEMLYLTWMGMAAKIQQRNEVVNRQCVDLQKRLSADGLQSCILKGQGTALLYGTLAGLRQSGDIDIWVKGDMDTTIAWMKQKGIILGDVDSVHVPADFFDDTEVEVHFRPSYMFGRKAERFLMDFFEKSADSQMNHTCEQHGFTYPTVAFNLVFSMVHINRHIYSEGIGLRQLLDYFMILKASTEIERKEAYDLLRQMKIGKFVAGIMHILKSYFGLEDDYLICSANAKEGEFLLEEIMRGGNFGHYDDRNSNLPKSMRWLRGWWSLKRMARYAIHYPSESFAMPFWKIRHYFWRKKNGYI